MKSATWKGFPSRFFRFKNLFLGYLGRFRFLAK